MSCVKSQLAPWSRIYEVVSLLEMLEFAARDYLEIAHQLGQMLAAFRSDAEKLKPDDIAEVIIKISRDCKNLNLAVTDEHINALFGEFFELKDGKMVLKQNVNFRGRVCHHAETIYSVLRAELGSMKIKAIPRDNNKYCDPKWLLESPMYEKYPDTVDELQRAGRCFAFGENTACVFHLMRVTDFYLRKVGESCQLLYDANNWHGIGAGITKKMEQKYQTKTDVWKANEPVYAEILADIQAIGRGHRNPVLHELEKKYDEREAEYLIKMIEKFAEHVTARL